MTTACDGLHFDVTFKSVSLRILHSGASAVAVILFDRSPILPTCLIFTHVCAKIVCNYELRTYNSWDTNHWVNLRHSGIVFAKSRFKHVATYVNLTVAFSNTNWETALKSMFLLPQPSTQRNIFVFFFSCSLQLENTDMIRISTLFIVLFGVYLSFTFFLCVLYLSPVKTV